MKLLENRIDAIVDNEAVILNVARKMGVVDRVSPAGQGTEPSFIYIAFSPKNEDSERYAHILSQGIIRLRANGRLREILGRYGIKDWK